MEMESVCAAARRIEIPLRRAGAGSRAAHEILRFAQDDRSGVRRIIGSFVYAGYFRRFIDFSAALY